MDWQVTGRLTMDRGLPPPTQVEERMRNSTTVWSGSMILTGVLFYLLMGLMDTQMQELKRFPR